MSKTLSITRWPAGFLTIQIKLFFISLYFYFIFHTSRGSLFPDLVHVSLLLWEAVTSPECLTPSASSFPLEHSRGFWVHRQDTAQVSVATREQYLKVAIVREEKYVYAVTIVVSAQGLKVCFACRIYKEETQIWIRVLFSLKRYFPMLEGYGFPPGSLEKYRRFGWSNRFRFICWRLIQERSQQRGTEFSVYVWSFFVSFILRHWRWRWYIPQNS
jgi:hypothetical protein